MNFKELFNDSFQLHQWDNKILCCLFRYLFEIYLSSILQQYFLLNKFRAFFFLSESLLNIELLFIIFFISVILITREFYFFTTPCPQIKILVKFYSITININLLSRSFSLLIWGLSWSKIDDFWFWYIMERSIWSMIL